MGGKDPLPRVLLPPCRTCQPVHPRTKNRSILKNSPRERDRVCNHRNHLPNGIHPIHWSPARLLLEEQGLHSPDPTHQHTHTDMPPLGGGSTNVSTYSKSNTVPSRDKGTPHGCTSRDSKHSYRICGHPKHTHATDNPKYRVHFWPLPFTYSY